MQYGDTRETQKLRTLICTIKTFKQASKIYTNLNILMFKKYINIIFFAVKDGDALYSQQKQDWELTVAQIMNSLLPNSDLN